MKPKDNNFSKTPLKIEWSNLIYLFVIIVLFTTVTILFFYSTKFIVKNINKIFSPKQEVDVSTLDLANYSLVAKKLNLPTHQEGSSTPPAITAPLPVVQEPVTPVPVTSELDKKSITISVLNSTSKAGVALTLAKKIEDAGFSKVSAEKEKKPYALTTILINNDKKEYKSLLEKIVKKSYHKAVTKIIKGKTEFDVTIIIGGK